MPELHETLIRVRPPRTGEHTLLSFENLLESLDFNEPMSLELVAEGEEVSMFIRSVHPDRVVQQMLAHYPDVELEFVADEDDPLVVCDDEAAWMQTLTPDGDEYLPLQIYDDMGLLEHGSDPFIDMIGGMRSDIQAGERLISRVLLKQKPHNWSEVWREKAMSGAGSENQRSVETERLTNRAIGVPDGASGDDRGGGESGLSNGMLFVLAGCVGILVAFSFAMRWLDEGNYMAFGALMTSGVIAGGVLTWGVVKHGWFVGKGQRYYDPAQVAMRVSGAAFALEINLIVVLRSKNQTSRAKKLLTPAVAAYRSFDNPLGCRFKLSKLVAADGLRKAAGLLTFHEVSGLGKIMWWQSNEGVVGVREAAALWHIPGASAQIAGLVRAGSKRLPVPSGVGHGVLVGVEGYGDGGERLVRLPMQVLRGHQLMIASSGQGKSTLMGHIIKGVFVEKAAGRFDGSVVVVDPHSDLISDILQQMPDGVSQMVKLIQVRNREHACGINLLDVHVFKSRNSVVETIIEVAKGSWETWGSRMQGIMEHGLKSLYEANLNLPREEQYTLLDLRQMLSDQDFRNEVLSLVDDSNILNWWKTDFAGYRPDTLADALAPVQNRIAFFAGSEVARRVLGQRYCTIDIAEVIKAGEVLLIDAYGGEEGEQIAALVGSALLKVVQSVIIEEGEKERVDRKGALVVVDEMQFFAGVPFEKMMRENRKFGGIMCLATQNLPALDQMSTSMRETMLGNIGCLFVFQVGGLDAQRLILELDSEHLTVEDVTALSNHNCYVRVKVEGKKPRYFSMQTLPPFEGTSESVSAILAGMGAYTRPVAEVDAEMNREMDSQVYMFRRALNNSFEATLDMSQGPDTKQRAGNRGKKKTKPAAIAVGD